MLCSSCLKAFFKNIIILFVFPPKFCISFVFNFSWDLQSPQEKLTQSFGGTIKNILVFLKKVYTTVYCKHRMDEGGYHFGAFHIEKSKGFHAKAVICALQFLK